MLSCSQKKRGDYDDIFFYGKVFFGINKGDECRPDIQSRCLN